MIPVRPASTLRLIALVLIGIGLVFLLDVAAEAFLAHRLSVGWGLLLLPAGIGLFRGRSRWTRLVLDVAQLAVIVLGGALVYALFDPHVAIVVGETELVAWKRTAAVAFGLLQVGLLLWLLRLGKRVLKRVLLEEETGRLCSAAPMR